MENMLECAIIILWLQLGWLSGEDQVEQSPQTLRVQEGDSVSLTCRYTVSGFRGLQWYRQDPGKGPKHLFLLYSVGNEQQKGRLSASLSQKESSLNITTPKAEDSATYLCAVEQGSGADKLVFGTGTRLTVIPYVKNPDPAVYQLRSPKSSNTSVCLFTDFDSKINVSQEPVSSVFSSNSMALDMRAVGSKSNGALRWSASPGFLCEETFNKTFYSSSGIPCDATLIEKSFETDMNLNFQNLSVIGLRILLLKVAGFNLLMTLRLWSS